MRPWHLLQRGLVGLMLLAWAPGIFGEPQIFSPQAVVEPKAEELSEEIKLMQQIEPGFVPKDERAAQLFMLQKIVADNDQSVKNKAEQTAHIRALFYQKFRSDLTTFSEQKVGPLDQRYQRSMEDLIKHYELALKNNPQAAAFAPDAMYFVGLYYFEIDEKAYFAKLAAYSKAKDEGRDDVPYPEENFTRTIDVFEKLIKKYPSFRHMGSVYYLLALALWYEGAFYQAVDYFQALIQKFPDSRYVEEVWFRLGEYFYDMDEYPEALDAYKRVVKNTKSPLYDKALYKLAWTYYQQDEFTKAIEHFIQVLELTQDEVGEGSAALMRSEVTRYIVKSFAELLFYEVERPKIRTGKNNKISNKDLEKEYAETMGRKLVESIVKYFDTHKRPKYLSDIYLETASQLLDESKSEGAILALQAVMALDPESAEAPRIDSQIIDILQEAHRLEEARQASLDLIKRYNKASPWYAAKAHDVKAQMIARDAVRDAMLSLAVYYHRAGKALKEAKNEVAAADNFSKAASYYLAYVREYPERDDTHKALFYFAESSYELNRFRTALDAYQLLKEYPLPMPDNFRRDATYNIVFTFKFVLEREAAEGRFKHIDFDKLSSKQRGLEKEEIPQLGLEYLRAIDDFVAMAPADEQVPVLLFHAAAIYYAYGHLDEALTRFFHIIDAYPQSGAASVAARLVIDDAISGEKWAQVAELAKRFRKRNLGGRAEDFARLEGNAKFKMALAVFSEANELNKNHQLAAAKIKYKESALMFETLLSEDPKSPYADIMLFNSARAIVQSGTTTAALPLYRRLYTEYPRSEFAPIARFQEALALEKMLKFSEAARAYDGIIKQDPTSEAAQDAMLNKALLYEAAGESTNAIEAFSAFAEKFPDRPEAPDALLTAASIYKAQAHTSQQIAMLERFIRQYRRDPDKIPAVIEAHVHIADTYGELAQQTTVPQQKQKYLKDQEANYRAAVGLFSQELQSPVASFYAAKAQLFLERPELEAFKKMAINGRTGKIQAEQLTAMMKKLTALTAKNEAIIRAFAQPVWNAESLYRIGSLYEHLAKAMLKAPCPTDVSEIDEFACDEYIVLLEDKAVVLEDKALDAYLQAYELAMSAYDTPPEMVDTIQAALNRLRPGKYQRIGHVIEKPVTGAFYGLGRMLSNGRMASGLHAKENDPDIMKPELPPVAEPSPEQNAPPVEGGE